MTKYRAAIVGLNTIGADPLPSTPTHPGLGIEWPPEQEAASISHASAFAVSPNGDVVAVCDLIEERTKQFLSDFQSFWPDVRTYTDYKKMLEDEEIDILGVVTSDHLHAQIVVDAAEAGVRGILCEKPLATTMADADRMIDACERHGVAMTVDHVRRYRPHWNGALAEFGDGPLGAVRRIVASYGGRRSMLFRNGTHLIDTVCMYAGGDPEWAIGVLDEEHQEYGPRYTGDGGKSPELEPGGSGLVQFDNGVRAFINISKRTTAEFELDVFAEEGRLRINNQSAEVWQPTTDTLPIVMTHRTLPVPQTLRDNTPAAVADLIQAIETGNETASPPREARKTVGIILAMLQSQAAGNRPVRFPIEDM